MPAQIIDGKLVADKLRHQYRQKVTTLINQGLQPGLAVILVGDNPASQIYIKNKINSCKEIGCQSFLYNLPYDTSENQLLDLIYSLNTNKAIHGILVQLPLPPHLNTRNILSAINHQKDIDGFSAYHIGSLSYGTPTIIPCTPAGIMTLLKFYKINVTGKHAVIIGRSNIVGKPLALLLLAAGATITICHSQTKHLNEHTKRADIIAVAVGQPHFLKAHMIKSESIIIDIGINRDEKGKICGDVDFTNIYQKASWITPVPGGVGPMTIAMLLRNTINAAQNITTDQFLKTT